MKQPIFLCGYVEENWKSRLSRTFREKVRGKFSELFHSACGENEKNWTRRWLRDIRSENSSSTLSRLYLSRVINSREPHRIPLTRFSSLLNFHIFRDQAARGLNFLRFALTNTAPSCTLWTLSFLMILHRKRFNIFEYGRVDTLSRHNCQYSPARLSPFSAV